MSEKHTIVTSGYFSGAPQESKRAFFERLDAALKPRGYRLLLLNLSTSPLETSCAHESVPQFVEIAEYLRIGGLFSDGGTERARLAASILAEGSGVSMGAAAAKVRLFREHVERLIARKRPVAFVLWHQFNAMHYSLPELLQARSVPRVFAEYGLLPGTVAFDGLGQMALSWVTTANEPHLSDADLDTADRFLAHLREARPMRRATDARGPLPEKLLAARDGGKRIVFYAGQNDFATGMLPESLPEANTHSPHFRDTRDALEALLSASERGNLVVLFKPHPLDKSSFSDIENVHPETLHLTRDSDIHECIHAADATATILSQVGYLAAMHEKPVVLLGRIPMSGKGCAYEIATRDELDDVVSDALNRDDFEAKQTAWKKHVAHVMRDYLFPMGDDAAPYFQTSAEDAAALLVELAKGELPPHAFGPSPMPSTDTVKPQVPRDSAAKFAYAALSAMSPAIRAYTRMRSKRRGN